MRLTGSGMTNVVEIDAIDGIATVTLNRPDKLNALNLEMWRALAACFVALDQDTGLRCVILRGANGHFAAGADLVEFRDHRWTKDQAVRYGETMVTALFAIRDCRHPTLAAIDGNCIGAGLELA